MPPMAWPMEEPTATPLERQKVLAMNPRYGGQVATRIFSEWEKVDSRVDVHDAVPGEDLRGSRGHLAEETGASALLRRGLHGRSLVLLRVGGSRVRLLMLGSRCRPSRGSGRASRAATSGGRGGTTALTRHFGCVDVYWMETGGVVLREKKGRYVVELMGLWRRKTLEAE